MLTIPFPPEPQPDPSPIDSLILQEKITLGLTNAFANAFDPEPQPMLEVISNIGSPDILG